MAGLKNICQFRNFQQSLLTLRTESLNQLAQCEERWFVSCDGGKPLKVNISHMLEGITNSGCYAIRTV